MNAEPDSLLCRLAGQTAAVHWLPTGDRLGGNLNDLLCFAWGLPDAGLPYQARTREDRTALDDLRRRGLVDVLGQTSGVHVRLTPTGAAGVWDLGPAAEYCSKIASMPTVTPPGIGPVVMGYELCPAAGDWWQTARASAAAWERYLDELVGAITALTPLFILGWARQFVSVDQQLFAVALTASGRAAATTQQPTAPAGFQFDGEAYITGRDEARRRFAHTPPDAGSQVARMLPSSRWGAA